MNLEFCYALQIDEALEQKPHVNQMDSIQEIYDTVKECGGIKDKSQRHFFERTDRKKCFSRDNVKIRRCSEIGHLRDVDIHAVEFVMAESSVGLYHHILETTASEVPF